MPIVVYNSENLPTERWAALCLADRQATIFHTHAWSMLWEAIRKDARAEWLVLVDDEGNWRGGMPWVKYSRYGITRIYSQPGGSYGGWIGSDIAGLLGANDWFGQFRKPWLGEMVVTPFSPHDLVVYPGRKTPRERWVLDLSSIDDEHSWVSNLRPDIARNLKLARRTDWHIRMVENIDDVGTTWKLWEQTAQRHQRRFDPPRRKLYQLLIDRFVAGRNLFWWTAADQQQVAATIICLRAGDWFHYYDGALDLTCRDGRPMYALFATAINTALSLGCRYFDFGAGPPMAEGLIRFKEGWGAVAEPYFEYHLRRRWWPRR